MRPKSILKNLMTALQTVGAKGHDGFAVALVTADP